MSKLSDILNDISFTNISQFSKQLTKWGSKNFRNFPWRLTNSDYQILIAEILLQRTKARQVEPVYLDFIKKFPNFESLNNSTIEAIENLIYPLGLYEERALRLKQLSEIILTEYKNEIPTDLSQLIKLPGIGDYVSRAFLCFGKNKRIAIIDSNIVRLYKRFFGILIKSEIRRNKVFIEFAESILPKKAKKFNYALLDFTNKICKPRKPNCNICILEKKCKKNY